MLIDSEKITKMLFAICSDNNIRVKKASGIPGNGYALAMGDKMSILLDETAGTEEKQFTLAHELGYILFGHLRTDSSISQEGMEAQADTFTAGLLAGAVLQGYYDFGRAEL